MTAAVLGQAVLGLMSLGNTTTTTGGGAVSGSSAVLGQAVLGQLVLGNTTTTAPPAGLPVWAPTLTQVGTYIPTRTREIGLSDSYMGTFTTQTTPTATQVTALLVDACAWVAAEVGAPVAAQAHDMMRVAAALLTAYRVELAYPERDADVSVYDRFRVDAEAAVTVAAQVNRANGGGAGTDEEGRPDVLAQYEFPDPPAWADVTFW